MLLSDEAIRRAIRGVPAPVATYHDNGRVSVSGANLAEWEPEVAYEGLAVEPFTEEHLNPASLDLTLSPVVRLMRLRHRLLDLSAPPLDLAAVPKGHTTRVDASRESRVDPLEGTSVQRGKIHLAPGGFLLGATNEVVTLPDSLAARVEGKSSLGRVGLAVHITAGFIDPGFHGSITLEIANLSPVPLVLHPGMRIAQIAFTPMAWPVRKTYGSVGRYQDQPAGEPVESRYGQ